MTTNKRVDDLLALAVQNGLQIDPTTITINESGLDFLAVFANTTDGVPWVLRAPRRNDVLQSAAYEKRVLDLLHNSLPVAVPDWQIYTPELIAYPKLQGVPAATTNPEMKNYDWYLNPQSLPPAFVESLAQALAALHGVDHDADAHAGLRVKQPAEVRASLAEKMNEVKRVFGVSAALWQRWQAWIADDSLWPEHSALVHGDLHPGHIVVDPDGRVTGLLDWTEAEVADPTIDFTAYYAIFGEAALADLLAHYEKAGGRIWPRIIDHIAETMAAYPLQIAAFALRSGLEEYMAMARATLGVDENGNEIEQE